VSSLFQQTLARFLRLTRLELLPVRVRSGLPAGARWTLFPWSAYWRGGYEPDICATIESLGDLSGKVCWDLGAHYGYYSVGLALRVGPRGRVVAFEPLPASHLRLQRHARLNDLTWLTARREAVSDHNGRTDFVAPTRESDTTARLPYDGEVPTADTPVIPTATVRLDDLVERGEIPPPHFIKIDVEGHGHHALAGAHAVLSRHRPIIIMGFHSPQEVAGARAVLDPLGYSWHPIGREASADLVGRDVLLRPQRPA